MIKVPEIVDGKKLNISRRDLKKGNDIEYFDVTWIPNNTDESTNNSFGYENIMKVINKTYPESIVISPEGINAVTLVRLLHEIRDNYYPSTREVERGGEFVEKYTSYELILNLKSDSRRKIGKV